VVEGARGTLILRCCAIGLVLMLVACPGREGPSDQNAVRKPVSRQTRLKTTPLIFSSETWLKGSISFDPATARDLSQSVALAVSIQVSNADEASRRLRANSLQDQCVRLSFLYRRGPSEPGEALGTAIPHQTSLWAPWPMICLYAGLQSTWHIALLSDQTPVQDVAHFILLTSGERRSANEQIAVVLFRPARNDAEKAQVVATSDWVSLSE
jgi:hypothetical protein